MYYIVPVFLGVGLLNSFFFASCISPPLPELIPPLCHRLLPLPFGPFLVWIRRVRCGGLPTSGHLEVQVIFCQLLHVHDEMSFPSGNFLLLLILLLYSCELSWPFFSFTKHQTHLPQRFQQHCPLLAKRCTYVLQSQKPSIVHCLPMRKGHLVVMLYVDGDDCG